MASRSFVEQQLPGGDKHVDALALAYRARKKHDRLGIACGWSAFVNGHRIVEPHDASVDAEPPDGVFRLVRKAEDAVRSRQDRSDKSRMRIREFWKVEPMYRNHDFQPTVAREGYKRSIAYICPAI